MDRTESECPEGVVDDQARRLRRQAPPPGFGAQSVQQLQLRRSEELPESCEADQSILGIGTNGPQTCAVGGEPFAAGLDLASHPLGGHERAVQQVAPDVRLPEQRQQLGLVAGPDGLEDDPAALQRVGGARPPPVPGPGAGIAGGQSPPRGVRISTLPVSREYSAPTMASPSSSISRSRISDP